jgi:mandelate racemase
MSKSVPAIRGVKVRVWSSRSHGGEDRVRVIDAAPMVLIDVETDQGVTGRSYIFATQG